MGVEERPHHGRRRGGLLGEPALGRDVAVLRHRHADRPRVDAGDLGAEHDATLEDVAGQDRLEVVEGQVEVDQLEGRGEPHHLTPLADPDGDLDLDGGGGPAGHRHRGAVGRHPRVGQVADDGTGQAEVLLDRGGVEADLPSHRRRPGGQLGEPARQEGAHAPRDGGGGVGAVGVGVGHRSSLAPPVPRPRSGRRDGSGAAGRRPSGRNSGPEGA